MWDMGFIGGGNLAVDGTPLSGTYTVSGAHYLSLQIAVINPLSTTEAYPSRHSAAPPL